jgi:hypothetical protein
MNVVELKKMVIDNALGNLKNELHYLIDRIAADKAFDQYNAKCEEADRLEAENERLRALVKDAYEEGWEDATCQPMGFDANWNYSKTRAALQPKEGE